MITLSDIESYTEKLWKENYDCNTGKKYYTSQNRLSDQELEDLIQAINYYNLPVTMHNTEFGFGCGMQIWSPEPAPIYPGIENKPTPLLLISQSHLPLSEASKMPDRTLFEDGWRVFSPLTHNQNNADLLVRCGLPAQKSKGYYEY